MNRNKVWIELAVVLFVLLVLVSSSVTLSADPLVEAGDAASFLRAGIGARALGMGGAFVALADDTTGGYWNSAGLANVGRLSIGGMMESRFSGAAVFQYLSAVFPVRGIGLGLTWIQSKVPDIVTGDSAFEFTDSAFLGSVGVGIGDLLLGVTGKYYRYTVPGLTGERPGAHGLGIDVGVLFRNLLGEENLSLGIVSQDIGWSKITWHGTLNSVANSVAWVNKVGLAWKLPLEIGSLTVAADLEFSLRRPPVPSDTAYLASVLQVDLSAGGEFWMGPFALRLGVANLRYEEGIGLQGEPTVGLGVRIREQLTIDAVARLAPQLGGIQAQSYALAAEFAF